MSLHGYGLQLRLTKETPMKTSTGLEYTEIIAGKGAQAMAGKTVKVHYTGKFPDGKVFDSSISRGEPFEFKLGAGRVIQGWDEGIALMKAGGKAVLTIPPHLAYGERGAGGVIPPNATLVFDVELLEVK
jgi:FKBP-type peptidyl-prolyl cis-trans isomerase